MPQMSGFEATAQIMRGNPDMIVIGLSVKATPENHYIMKRAGAVRLIQKEQASQLLYDAIHESLKSRETPKPPPIAQ